MYRYGGLRNKPASKLGYFLALIWVLGESISDGDKSGEKVLSKLSYDGVLSRVSFRGSPNVNMPPLRRGNMENIGTRY